jgi:uncharacterized damage-inducible protein DinB
MSSMLREMFDHMAWADARVIALLTASPDAARVSGVLRLLSHVVAAERVWLGRIRAEDGQHPVWPEWTLPQVQTTAEENAAAYAELVSHLTDDEATRAIDYRNSQGVAFRTRLRDILLHVALHGSYHRGQIAAALRAAGVAPAGTDYIIYVREQPN